MRFGPARKRQPLSHHLVIEGTYPALQTIMGTGPERKLLAGAPAIDVGTSAWIPQSDAECPTARRFTL